MNKTKFSIEKIGKYLREVSVVMIGVAITLLASNIIGNSKDKRDMTLFLNTIKLELEENIRLLDETNLYVIQPAMNYRNYLISHDKTELDVDSLKNQSMYYGGTIYNATSLTIKTNAFDMFKTSGYMRLMDNNDLLLSIWNSYAILVEAKNLFDKYSDMKSEEMRKYFSSYGNMPSDEDILKYPPLYEVYVNIPIPFIQNSNYERAKSSLEETLSKFEIAK